VQAPPDNETVTTKWRVGPHLYESAKKKQNNARNVLAPYDNISHISSSNFVVKQSGRNSLYNAFLAFGETGHVN
jgi:hypothetical protein